MDKYTVGPLQAGLGKRAATKRKRALDNRASDPSLWAEIGIG
jgi:hypothetical protein